MTSTQVLLTPAAALTAWPIKGLVHAILVPINGGFLMALLMALIILLNEERRAVSTAAS